MGLFVNRGNLRFKEYTNGEYIDKTAMLAYINATLNTTNRLSCVSRPRRFGKSIAASMLCAYYDKSCDSSNIFDNLSISQNPSYKEHLNKYHVLNLDVTNFVSEFRGDNNIIKYIQEYIKEDLMGVFPEANITESTRLMAALLKIVNLTQTKFIFVIDEWDALCRELANRPEIMDEYIDLLRRMFKSNDTADVFAGVYMTGILPIKKYGTQSALNDFREYSMTTPGAMGGFLGFNDNDVQSLATKYDMDFAELKRWYNGYQMETFDWRQPNSKVSKINVYNPNSVMTAIRDRRCNNYWAMTEAFEALQQYIDCDFDGVKETLDKLIHGNTIQINVLRFGHDITSVSDNEELFTLLIHFGYLSYDPDLKHASLPNQEIREEFVEALRGSKSHKELSALVKRSDKLLDALLMQDEEAVAKGVEYIHNSKVAPNFYNNEQALRSVVRTAFLGAIDFYIEIQELPSGKGYADLVFVPRKNSKKPVLLIELKWNEPVHTAINQIHEQNYPEVLKEFSEDILLVAICYDKDTKQHTCKIERITI